MIHQPRTQHQTDPTRDTGRRRRDRPLFDERERRKRQQASEDRQRIRRRLRRRLWNTDPHCWYCGRLLFWSDSTLDHFYPTSAGGTDHFQNLRLACRLCNRMKDAALPHLLVCRIVPGEPVLQLIDYYLRSPATMSKEPIGFNYDMLEGKLKQATERHAKAIHKLVRQTTAGIVEIGRRLHEVRETMDSRVWNAWLRAEFRWGKSTASNFMQVSEKFGHLDCLEQFDHSALYVLVRRNVDERAVKAAVKEAEDGKPVTHKRAVELVREFASVTEPGPKPAAIHGLRHAIKELSANLEALLSSCSADELNGMADELLQLALQLRTAIKSETPAAAVQPETPKPEAPKPTAKAKRGRRKSDTSAAA